MAMLNNQMVQIEVWMSFDDFGARGGQSLVGRHVFPMSLTGQVKRVIDYHVIHIYYTHVHHY